MRKKPSSQTFACLLIIFKCHLLCALGARGAAPVSSQAKIKSLASCCSMWVQLSPSPGLKPPWRDRSSEASAETLRPALSRPSHCRWPQTPPCNRQGRSLERGTTPTWHHDQDMYVFVAAIRRSRDFKRGRCVTSLSQPDSSHS